MINGKAFVLINLALLIASLLWGTNAAAKDITNQVIRETELDEQVAQFCFDYCLGNRRQGKLTGVYIDHIQGSLYRVVATARLRSRNDGILAFDRTALIKAVGVLDRDTCNLRIENVEVENDFQNALTNLINEHADLMGTERNIPDCGRFIE